MLIYLNIPVWAPHLQMFQVHIVIIDHKWWNIIILWKENFSGAVGRNAHSIKFKHVSKCKQG